jgi:hypothetical protein
VTARDVLTIIRQKISDAEKAGVREVPLSNLLRLIGQIDQVISGDPEIKTNVLAGGCLCGTVRYEGSGEPYNITHCHCEDCRKSAGAPFVTWASFRRDNFRFTQGEPREIEWAGRVRSFCPNCGTALTLMSGVDSNEIDITVATFDRPEIVPPADHTWTEDRLPWIKLADNLPQHVRARGNDRPDTHSPIFRG